MANIDDEFSTIDTLLASEAQTRGVDAFALALIKAERQMRKLFTYLVFQSPAFSAHDIKALQMSSLPDDCTFAILFLRGTSSTRGPWKGLLDRTVIACVLFSTRQLSSGTKFSTAS